MNNQGSTANRWRAIPPLIVTGGVALVVLSFMLPAKALSRSGWTREQAKQYQAASLKLHSLSHAALHPAPDSDRQARQQALQQADAEYQAIRAQLEAATKRPRNIAFTMRLLGGGLIAVGGVAFYFGRPEPPVP